MANFLIFLNALPVIWKFWGEFKAIFQAIGKMKKKYDVQRFCKKLNESSQEADDNGNTEGYEDIISGGR